LLKKVQAKLGKEKIVIHLPLVTAYTQYNLCTMTSPLKKDHTTG